MRRIRPLNSKELIKLLEQRGFLLDRVKGSHHIFLHPTSRKRVVVPMHNRELPIGTFLSILKQAGIDKSEL